MSRTFLSLVRKVLDPQGHADCLAARLSSFHWALLAGQVFCRLHTVAGCVCEVLCQGHEPAQAIEQGAGPEASCDIIEWLTPVSIFRSYSTQHLFDELQVSRRGQSSSCAACSSLGSCVVCGLIPGVLTAIKTSLHTFCLLDSAEPITRASPGCSACRHLGPTTSRPGSCT